MTENSPTITRDTTVFQALIEVRRRVGAVRKDSRSEQPGARFNFRGIDAVVNASAGPLIDCGVSIVPEAVVSCVQVDVKSGSKRTDMQATRLTIRFRVYGPGDSFPIEAAGEAFDSGDKSTPKASSIAWRTALLQVLHIPTDEPDPDSFHYDRNDPARQVDEQQQPDPLGEARGRAWKATEGAGTDERRRAIVEQRLAELDPPASPQRATVGAWTAVAVKLELEGFTPPADEPAPEPQSQDAGPGFPVSGTEQF